jgi:SlyX protein
MNDGRNLSERIDTLEARVTYQDDTIETLNQTITAQWREIDALKRQIALMSERLEEAGAAGGEGPVDEPPPHY